MSGQGKVSENNGCLKTQPVEKAESDGDSFMTRLNILQEQLNRITTNLRDHLVPITRDEGDLAMPSPEAARQPQTGYFMEAGGFLNNVENDIDRLNSLLTRLEN